MRDPAVNTVYINGRFLTRQLTGVERVATEILQELVPMIAQAPAMGIKLAVVAPKMEAGQQEVARKFCADLSLPIRFCRTRGYLWEQLELPLVTKGQVVLSFCNLGPALKRRQLVVIHDAQVYTHPGSYTRLFRTAYKILLPILGRVSQQVVTVSMNTRTELEAVGVLPKAKARVIHNAADHILRIEPDSETLLESPYFLVLGSQAAHKNLASVIAAMSDYKTGDIPLAIVGGKNSRVFKGIDEGDKDGIKRLDRVTDEQLVSLYQNATALVFPSLTEGFGIPPLEAMQSGCAVIASDGGAIPEVCGDAVIYVSAKDVNGWQTAMREVGSKPDNVAELRKKGLAQAEKYSWRKTAEQYLHILQILVPGASQIAEDPETSAEIPLEHCAQQQGAAL